MSEVGGTQNGYRIRAIIPTSTSMTVSDGPSEKTAGDGFTSQKSPIFRLRRRSVSPSVHPKAERRPADDLDGERQA